MSAFIVRVNDIISGFQREPHMVVKRMFWNLLTGSALEGRLVPSPFQTLTLIRLGPVGSCGGILKDRTHVCQVRDLSVPNKNASTNRNHQNKVQNG